MIEGLTGRVYTRLYRVDRFLRLTRSGAEKDGLDGGILSVLFIPRCGGPCPPRLATFTTKGGTAGPDIGRLLDADAHTVVRVGSTPDPADPETADVLLHDRAPHARLPHVLDDYPGCSVAVTAEAGRCHAAVRGRPIVRAVGDHATGVVWSPLCGSFLYAWSTAGLPLESLTAAVIIAGRLRPPSDDAGGVLEVMGRVAFTVRDENGPSVRRAAS
ncbi:hypothetical protein [Actinomadura rayongensis]|uniref:Uncharacterized protein n=1 Tax=Actinomadura rayongensis TaxID=1429076 RepID=A0A6I4WAK1_9ACTN|nr:hypothetical protein [Actinomadura rayongensis]MXQ67909.1 hypothetical protein [Actinomadura rayongensis]